MAGSICVQGGDEFTDACRAVDEAWIARAPVGAVSVVPLACAGGAEYRIAGRNGVEYLRDLGVADVSVAPEPDLLPDGAVRSIIDARVVFIPGGSPARIRKRVIGTAVGGALRAHSASGGMLVGASAGAMVLCDSMLVPGDDMTVHPGLGLLPDMLVLPHYDQRRDALVARARGQAAGRTAIIGLPACCGVLFGDHETLAFGSEPCWRFTADADPVQITRG